MRRVLLLLLMGSTQTLAAGIYLPTEACKITDPKTPQLHYNLWPLRKDQGQNDRATFSNITLLLNLCGSLVDELNMQGCNKDVSACILRPPHPATSGGQSMVQSLTVVEHRHLRYTLSDGDVCPSDTKQNQRVLIDLMCDPKAGRGVPMLVDALDHDCELLVHWQTQYACPEDGNAPQGVPQDHRRSGGWIFFWIVFSCVLAYVVLGVAYKRMRLGCRGWDQLPHADFWLRLGSRLPFVGQRYSNAYHIRL